jgi:hypothetical protein
MKRQNLEGNGSGFSAKIVMATNDLAEEQNHKPFAYSVMRVFIGFVIAAIILFVADQYFSYGYFTDRILMMLNHMTRSFGL